MKFELFQSEKNQQYYFRLKAGNGQIILQSEGYTTKTAAKNGIESVKKNAGLDERYERKEAANGKFQFVLKAGNHQIIGQSQLYASKDSMENGIESVKKNGVNGEIVEIEKD
jgi:hypothetical protein